MLAHGDRCAQVEPHGDSARHVEPEGFLLGEDLAQRSAELVRSKGPEAKPAIVGTVPRHVAEGRQCDGLCTSPPCSPGNCLDEPGADAASLTGVQHGELLDMRAGIDRARVGKADRHVVAVAGNPEAAIPARLVEHRKVGRRIVIDRAHADGAEDDCRVVLDQAASLQVTGPAGPDGDLAFVRRNASPFAKDDGIAGDFPCRSPLDCLA